MALKRINKELQDLGAYVYACMYRCADSIDRPGGARPSTTTAPLHIHPSTPNIHGISKQSVTRQPLPVIHTHASRNPQINWQGATPPPTARRAPWATTSSTGRPPSWVKRFILFFWIFLEYLLLFVRARI